MSADYTQLDNDINNLILDLPVEIIFEMLYLLDREELMHICSTHTLLASICRDEFFWMKKVEKDSGIVTKSDDVSWKEVYKHPPNHIKVLYEIENSETNYPVLGYELTNENKEFIKKNLKIILDEWIDEFFDDTDLKFIESYIYDDSIYLEFKEEVNMSDNNFLASLLSTINIDVSDYDHEMSIPIDFAYRTESVPSNYNYITFYNNNDGDRHMRQIVRKEAELNFNLVI